jgi:hypothetical protein
VNVSHVSVLKVSVPALKDNLKRHVGKLGDAVAGDKYHPSGLNRL